MTLPELVSEQPLRAYIDRKADAPTEWATPRDFYERLDNTFGPFNLDPASNCGGHGEGEVANYVCEPYYCLGCGQDGLEEPWFGKVYVNPPFDRSLPLWVAKAEKEAMAGEAKLVAMLLPVRTGRKWWQFMRPDSIIYLPGRLKFGGASNSAPFDCCVVLWWQL